MTLPDQIDPEQVDISPDLDIRDTTLLEILLNADAPVLSTNEIVSHEEIDVKSRSVQMHLTKLEKGEKDDDGERPGEGSDKTGYVRRKESGSGSVWWVPDEILKTEEEEPPEREEVIAGLREMASHDRRALRAEFPEFKGLRPPALRWGTRFTLFGVFTAIAAVFIPDPTSATVVGSLTGLLLFAAASMFTGGIALGLIHFLTVFEARLGENGVSPSRLHPALRYFKRYAIPAGAVSLPIAFLASAAGYPVDVVGGFLFVASLIIGAIGLFVLVLMILVDAWKDPGYYKEKVVGY